MSERPKIPFKIDPEKIGNDEKARSDRRRFITECLLELEEKKPFGPGDIVTTLSGQYAEIGLKVIEVKENGMTTIIPKPDADEIEIPTADLYHFDDYHEAFKASLVHEQHGGGFDTLQ